MCEFCFAAAGGSATDKFLSSSFGLFDPVAAIAKAEDSVKNGKKCKPCPSHRHLAEGSEGDAAEEAEEDEDGT